MGQYSSIQCAIEIYHGEDDNLIYPTNSIEFEKLAVKATVTKHYTQGGHHAYIWKQDFLIKNQLRTDLL
jgi:pimeloyl-ACP methyl ester carboxylesterase